MPDAAVSPLKQALLHHVTYSLGTTVDQLSPRERFSGPCSGRARPHDRRTPRNGTALSNRPTAKRLYYLSMEFLIGRSLHNNLVNLGLLDEARQVLADLGLDLDDVGGLRARRGPGQRRPRPAGGLLPRLAGHARHARLRLRHQLRIRPVQAGDPQRRTGREARQLAHLSHALDRSNGRRTRFSCPLYGRIEHATDRYGQLQPDVARLEGRHRRAARHARSLGYGGQHASTTCACSPPGPRTNSTWASSTRAITSTPCSRRC